MTHTVSQLVFKKLFRIFLLVVILVSLCILPIHSTAYAAEDAMIVVSMGDSYSSGEGHPEFYGVADGDYEDAHRSKVAWPGRLVVGGDGSATQLSDIRVNYNDFSSKNDTESQWRFVAHTGATTDNFETAQDSSEKQYAAFEGIGGRVDYVTMTIGGNDLDFVGVLASAYFGKPYPFAEDIDVVIKQKTELLDGYLGEKLRSTYIETHRRAGFEAKIIIAGYPDLISLDRAPAAIDSNDVKLINEGVDYFNTTVRNIVTDLNNNRSYDRDYVGDPHANYAAFNLTNTIVDSSLQDSIFYFVDVNIGTDSFKGHGAFANNGEYINGVDILDVTNFKKAYHPNAEGLGKYTYFVQKKINEIQNGNSATIEDIAINVTMDLSTSMDSMSAYGSNSKLAAAREQAANFVRVLENQNNMNDMPSVIGLTGFSDAVYTNMPLSDDYGGVQSAINNLDTISDTNLYAGLSAGISQLEGSTGQKIMIFLSDGEDTHGNTDAELISLARDAAAKGIKIYVVGFGAASDINEYLLEQIATVTGGTYAHEDPASATSAAVGLFGMMTYAQLSATSEVLAEHVGTVAQDQLADAGDFKVVGYGNIHIVLYWPGSILDLKLTDPGGTQIAQGYQGFSTQTDGTVTTVNIDGAKEGDWNMSVYGTEVSMSEEPYYAIAAFNETEAPLVSSGAAPDNGTGLLILLVVVAVFAVGGVAAFSFRKKERTDEEKFEL